MGRGACCIPTCRHGIRNMLAACFALLAMAAIACADEEPAGLSLSLDLARSRAYPGESIPVTVILQVSGVTVRNIGYPRIDTHGLPPIVMENHDQQQGDVGNPATYRFAGQVTPGKAGTFTIGPAQIDCDVMETATGSAAFFGESEPRRVTLRSSPRQLTILPLPAKGRPDDFNGAVGRFTLAMTARPVEVELGDPVTVTTTIGGVGNLDRISCPSFQPPGFRTYPPKVNRHPDILRCEQVLIPEHATTHKLQTPSLSYFDPAKARYLRTSGSPVTVRVIPPATTPPPPEKRLPVNHQETTASLSKVGLATSALLAVLLPVLFLCRLRRQREAQCPSHPAAITSPPPDCAEMPQRVRTLLDTADPYPFYTALYRAVQTILTPYAAGKPTAAITSVPPLHEALPLPFRSNYTRLAWLLAECDQVRFGRQERSPAARREALTVLEEVLSLRKGG